MSTPTETSLRMSAEGHRQREIRPAAERAAILELVFLIAVHGIDQVMREVVPQMQLVVDEERARGELPVAEMAWSLNERLERHARPPSVGSSVPKRSGTRPSVMARSGMSVVLVHSW